jgi:hypothetical protein
MRTFAKRAPETASPAASSDANGIQSWVRMRISRCGYPSVPAELGVDNVPCSAGRKRRRFSLPQAPIRKVTLHCNDALPNPACDAYRGGYNPSRRLCESPGAFFRNNLRK